MRAGRIVLLDGWLLAAAATTLAATTALVVVTSATSLGWLATRLTVFGLLALVLGLVVGSEQLVGAASLPMLGAALVATSAGGDPAWGRSMVIGCLWYLALELAWASIERRDDTIRTAEIERRRLQEVATIVVIAVVVGLGGAAAASIAPTRTLLVRALVVAVVLLGMLAGIRRLAATAPDSPEQAERPT